MAYPSGDKSITLEYAAPPRTGKFPAVVLLHGSGGLEQATGPLFRQVAVAIARHGYVVVIPHFFEKTDHAIGVRLVDGEYEAMTAAVQDAVTYLAEQPQVDATRLAMIGLSMGSNLAMVTAVRDPRIRAVACWSGSFPSIPPNKKLPPLLILHGSADASTPLQSAQAYADRLAEQGMPYGMHVYQGMPHNFDSVRLMNAAERTREFFDRYVKNAADIKLSPPIFPVVATTAQPRPVASGPVPFAWKRYLTPPPTEKLVSSQFFFRADPDRDGPRVPAPPRRAP